MKRLILVILLAFAALAPATAQNSSANQAYGIAAKRPVLQASCRHCPWGALGDILKTIMAPAYDVAICYGCSGCTGYTPVQVVPSPIPAPAPATSEKKDGHHSSVTAASLAVTSTRALSGAVDGSLRLWDVETGRSLASFTADAPMSACAFVGEDLIAVAGDESGQIHILEIVK